MKKHLYEIQRSKLPSYLKWWFIKYKHAGVLSEVMENLTSPITLQVSLRRKFKIFQISGNSVQDGEPSPETLVPNQNVTGEVDVKVKNKNLYTGNIVNLGIGTNSSSSTGYALTYGTNLRGTYIKCKPNQILSISRKDTSNNRFRIGFTEIEPVNGATVFNYMNRDSFLKVEDIIVPENVNYMLIYLSNDGTLPVDFMIEEGSTATQYEPHEEQTVTFPLEEGQVLHESDTIEDKIVQNKQTVILDGTETINFYRQDLWDDDFVAFGIRYTSKGQKMASGLTTNKFNFASNVTNVAGAALNKDINKAGISNDGNIYVLLSPTIASSIEEMATYLAEQYANGAPWIAEGTLETPIEIPFTEAQRTAKAQIDKLYSYKGTTYISSNNEPSPKFKIQYVKEE